MYRANRHQSKLPSSMSSCHSTFVMLSAAKHLTRRPRCFVALSMTRLSPTVVHRLMCITADNAVSKMNTDYETSLYADMAFFIIHM